MKQSWWNSHSETVKVHQSLLKSHGGTFMVEQAIDNFATVKVEQSWWTSDSGPVMVEQS